MGAAAAAPPAPKENWPLGAGAKDKGAKVRAAGVCSRAARCDVRHAESRRYMGIRELLPRLVAAYTPPRHRVLVVNPLGAAAAALLTQALPPLVLADGAAPALHTQDLPPVVLTEGAAPAPLTTLHRLSLPLVLADGASALHAKALRR